MTTVPQRVHVVVPQEVNDPRHPSGGNVYDRRVCAELAALGWDVAEHRVAGAWPTPGPGIVGALAAALRDIPDGEVAIVDGLVGSAVPEVMVPEADRLTIIVLLHMLASTRQHRQRERPVLASAAAVVTTSRWAREQVLADDGLSPVRVHAAPPGVDPAGPAVGTPTGDHLLCVGAVTPLKGYDVLLAALSDLGARSWRCTCIGPLDVDPGFAATLRREAVALGPHGRVRFTGPVPPAGLQSAYAEADLVVVPSRQETYAMVVTEALARAIPVVASDTGGIPEAVGVDAGGPAAGLLVPPGDPRSLGHALRTWLDEPQTRSSLRAGARRRRTQLTGWAETAAQIADVVAGIPVGRR